MSDERLTDRELYEAILDEEFLDGKGGEGLPFGPWQPPDHDDRCGRPAYRDRCRDDDEHDGGPGHYSDQVRVAGNGDNLPEPHIAELPVRGRNMVKLPCPDVQEMEMKQLPQRAASLQEHHHGCSCGARA